MLARIDHIGVAVEDLDAALALYERDFAIELVHRETVTEQGVEAVLLDVGENHVELLAPLGPDTPVGKFLAKKGPGLHHVAYQTPDIDAELERLKAAGLRLIDEQPRTGIRGSRVAFLHPAATGGVLTEIVEPRMMATSETEKVTIGFFGGGLSLRLETKEARQAAQEAARRRLARHRGRGRHRPREPRRRRLRADRPVRAPRRLRPRLARGCRRNSRRARRGSPRRLSPALVRNISWVSRARTSQGAAVGARAFQSRDVPAGRSMSAVLQLRSSGAHGQLALEDLDSASCRGGG